MKKFEIWAQGRGRVGWGCFYICDNKAEAEENTVRIGKVLPVRLFENTEKGKAIIMKVGC